MNEETMVVVAGHCRFPAEHRDAALAEYHTLVEAARRAPGCIDLSITADPIDPERIAICEIWAGEEHLNAWRRTAPHPKAPRGVKATDLEVWEYVVANRRAPFSGGRAR
ncbi:MAG: antibiotic biosynthesis monooxygenase family protein [Rhodococcus sp. (in: high G+C Gram-positive bacteria)]|uniref:putative quinol monooxygenase n=1 Tax=Rhodococcus sp. TaxID=1831 RepID=UPI003BB596C9